MQRLEAVNLDYEKKLSQYEKDFLQREIELDKAVKDKEEQMQQVKQALDREKLLSEKVYESDYLRKLLEKQLDVTYPDMTQSDISLRQSITQDHRQSVVTQEHQHSVTNVESVLKDVQAVMDAEQQHVTLVFEDLGLGDGLLKMQNKIRLLPADSSVLLDASRLLDSSTLVEQMNNVEAAISASPSSQLLSQQEVNDVDNSLIQLQEGGAGSDMHKPFDMMESTDRNAEYEEDYGELLKSSHENANAFLQGSGEESNAYLKSSVGNDANEFLKGSGHEINEFLESAEADQVGETSASFLKGSHDDAMAFDKNVESRQQTDRHSTLKFNESQVMLESESPGEVFEANEIQPIGKNAGVNMLMQSQDTLRHIGELNDDLQGGRSSNRPHESGSKTSHALAKVSAQELENAPDLATQLCPEEDVLPQTQQRARHNNRRGVTLNNLDFNLMESVPEDVKNEESMLINSTSVNASQHVIDSSDAV